MTCLGVDVARSGSDDTVLAPRHGLRIEELRRYSLEDTMATTGRVAGGTLHGGVCSSTGGCLRVGGWCAMPMRPKNACPVCRRVGCTGCRPQVARPSSPAREARKQRARPTARTWREIVRRREAVAAHRAQFGDWCPLCGRWEVVLTADHVVPVARGGAEDGELRVICRGCNSRLGATMRGSKHGGGKKS